MPKPLAAAFARFLKALKDFRAELAAEAGPGALVEQEPMSKLPLVAEAVAGFSARPPSGFAVSFIQAMFWALLGAMMSMLSELVRERMTGTFERLRASPASAGTFSWAARLRAGCSCSSPSACLCSLPPSSVSDPKTP